MWLFWKQRLGPIRTFQPENEGGAGGGAGGAGGEGNQPAEEEFVDPFDQMYQHGSADEDDFDDDEDDGEELMDTESLMKMFAPKKDEAGGKPNGQQDSANDPKRNQQQANELKTQLQQQIQSMTLPDDVFGEDFDRGDPGAMRQAIQKATQHAVANAVAMAMKPTQMAMGQLQTDMMAQVKAQIAESQQTQMTEGKLNAQVPALNDPAAKAMLEPMRQKLHEDGVEIEEQARVLNSIANQLGLNKKTKRTGAKGSGNPKPRTGKDAMKDLFG